MPDTIPSMVLKAAASFGDRTAFHFFDETWKTMSYGELLELVRAGAGYLKSRGIVKGDRVAIVAENRPEWPAAYLSIVFCGAVAVPIDIQLGPDDIGNLVRNAGVACVIHSIKTEKTVLRCIEGTEIMAVAVEAMKTGEPLSRGYEGAGEIEPSDLASIIYTSGTTGVPKGVMLSHENFCSDAAAVHGAHIVSEHDNVLSVLPLHHTYPFMCTFLVPLSIGASVTFSPGLKAADIIAAVRETGVTVIVAVPRLLELIRNGVVAKMKELGVISRPLMGLMRLCGALRRQYHVNAGKAIFRSVHSNFRTLRFFTSGGARLDPGLMTDLEALGFTILEGYGLTETAPIVTFNPPEKRVPGSAGQPLPGVQIGVADDGEIMIKGPMVTSGYYRNEKATAGTFRDGWFLTGDTGYLDDRGYLFITGRKKEVIVLSTGKNVYPEDVERAYLVIPLIKEICVTVPPRGAPADALHAVIVPDLDYARKSHIGNMAETLRWQINEVSQGLPEYQRVRGFTLHGEPLPRTPLGKLRRFLVTAILEGKEQGAPEKGEDGSLREDEIGRGVVSCIISIVGDERPVHGSDNLELDLGFDSLRRIEFVSAVEKRFGISLPDTFMTEVQTVGDVVTKIRESGVEGGSARDREARDWSEILQIELTEEDARKAGFSHGPLELAWLSVVFPLVRLCFRAFFRLRVEGKENVPSSGPFIFAPNHRSYLDGFVVGFSFPFSTYRNLSFLGLQQFFRGRTGAWIARMSHVITIDPETYFMRSLQLSAHVLRKGRSLCIFPEGGRSFSDEVLPFKKGIGVLAVELDVAVIPVYLEGTGEALPRGARFIRLKPLRVIIGKPLRMRDIDMSARPGGVDAYQYFADTLRERVIALSQQR